MATDAYDRRAMDVFGELAELPAGQREARLDSLCSDDAALRDRVLTLLHALAPTTPPPAENLTPSWFVDTSASSRTRVEQIGPYRLLGRIGVGGMSEVYEAEQERPRRRVALKLIQPQRMTPMMRRRFEFEVEVLGRLEHPGIARVYDAGTEHTPYGPQPYFAMELVRGQRLDRWIRMRRPTLTQRLRVLTALCDAVQHAHQHGVIHRDLKPSNIIVTEDGTPKVLDFGVAAAVRVAAGEAGAQTQYTATGQIIGTLQYMSPEQAAGDPRQLDTRSDVYALGVIAYELLADRLPYEVSDKPLPEAVRVILSAEPTRLSTINKDLRGDLETIVFKAMEKDKQRRYASAAELGADVRRYLEYEPITARPPSLTYQLGKFARRHKALVGAVAAVFVVLVAGVIVSTAALLRARHAQLAGEQRQKESEWARQTSEEINLFLNDMLASVDPSLAQGKEVTVREVLGRAGEEMAGRFDDQPVVEGELQNTIGRTYLSLGVFDRARDHLARSVEARRRALGEDHPNTLASRNNLALALDSLGDSEAAEHVHRDVLATKTRTLGGDHADTLTTLNNLACNLDDQGRFDAAQTMHHDALARRRRALGDAHADTLQSLHNLGSSLLMSGRGCDALPLLNEAVQQRTKTLGPTHPSTLASLASYARALCDGGRDAEAEPLLRDIVDRCRSTFGAEHANTLTTMGKWAHALGRLGRHADAERVCADAIARGCAALGEKHPIVLQLINEHATILLELGRRDEAEQTWRALLGRNQAAPELHDVAAIAIKANLGALLNQSHRFNEAEPFLRDVVSHSRAGAVPPLRTTRYWCEYARCLSGLGRYREARASLLEAREQLIAAGATHTEQMHDVVAALVDACEAVGVHAEATQWRNELALLARATRPATGPAPY